MSTRAELVAAAIEQARALLDERDALREVAEAARAIASIWPGDVEAEVSILRDNLAVLDREP